MNFLQGEKSVGTRLVQGFIYKCCQGEAQAEYIKGIVCVCVCGGGGDSIATKHKCLYGGTWRHVLQRKLLVGISDLLYRLQFSDHQGW